MSHSVFDSMVRPKEGLEASCYEIVDLKDLELVGGGNGTSKDDICGGADTRQERAESLI